MKKDRVILLKTVRYGEADLILTGLSYQGAKMVFFAPGALSSRRRFGYGVLEPSHYVEISFRTSRRHGSLTCLQEASLVNDFSFLRKNYECLDIALSCLILVEKISQECLANRNLFELLGNTLSALNQTAKNIYQDKCQNKCFDKPQDKKDNCGCPLINNSKYDLLAIKTLFQVKLLSIEGILPYLANKKEILETSVMNTSRLMWTEFQWQSLLNFCCQRFQNLFQN